MFDRYFVRKNNKQIEENESRFKKQIQACFFPCVRIFKINSKVLLTVLNHFSFRT